MPAKVKKGDRVIVTAGKDKGKRGEVLRVYPSEERVLVSGVNVVKRHQRQIGARARRHHLEGIAGAHLQDRACRSQVGWTDPRRVQDCETAGWCVLPRSPGR